MKIKTLTLFPEIYDALKSGIIGRALEKELFSVETVHIRDFSEDKHKKCDDYPFGGGAGMVMTPQPLHSAIIASDPNHEYKRIYLSPKGRVLNQQLVKELSALDKILLINGCYEGVDQRVLDMDVDMEISAGDYVLTSGDFASLVLINAISRYVDGVLGSSESAVDESFSDGLLEYPQYTRPQEFLGVAVPEVLLSGNHAEVARWRKAKSLELTKLHRPDLLDKK